MSTQPTNTPRPNTTVIFRRADSFYFGTFLNKVTVAEKDLYEISHYDLGILLINPNDVMQAPGLYQLTPRKISSNRSSSTTVRTVVDSRTPEQRHGCPPQPGLAVAFKWNGTYRMGKYIDSLSINGQEQYLVQHRTLGKMVVESSEVLKVPGAHLPTSINLHALRIIPPLAFFVGIVSALKHAEDINALFYGIGAVSVLLIAIWVQDFSDNIENRIVVKSFKEYQARDKYFSRAD